MQRVSESKLDRKSEDFLSLQKICDRLAAPLQYADGIRVHHFMHQATHAQLLVRRFLRK